MCRPGRKLRDRMDTTPSDMLRADDGKGYGNLKIRQRPGPGRPTDRLPTIATVWDEWFVRRESPWHGYRRRPWSAWLNRFFAAKVGAGESVRATRRAGMSG